LASYDIDDEGIVPPDEVIIVEKGVLKNLLNDRTMTQSTQTANGFSSGPGVIEVTTTHKNSEKELKEKLIAAAKAEGLDFGLMVKHSPNLMGITNVYKVNVKDGSEELLRNAFLQDVSFKMFRRILGASGTYLAHNIGASNYLLNANDNSQKTSYIVPEAILLESMEIKPFEMPTLKEDDYVSNPLGKSNK
jgi:PmbA/TldA metallopeptidase C-terminal domain